jgi:protein tyrosine/serine phosphatase
LILDLPYNFHWVEPREAARSAQAYAGFLRPFLQAHGIRGVINLRGSNPGHLWWRYETRICARAGIVHCDVKLNSRQLPAQATLVSLIDAFDAMPRPFLLKCSGGQDRTSLAAALYLLHRNGWQELAKAEMQFARWPYLHLPHKNQRWLRLFPQFANEQACRTSLRDWLATTYSARSFRDWLERGGEGASFRGLYGVPGSAPKR